MDANHKRKTNGHQQHGSDAGDDDPLHEDYEDDASTVSANTNHGGSDHDEETETQDDDEDASTSSDLIDFVDSEDENEDEEEEAQQHDNLKKNIAHFTDGLTWESRMRVKDARALHFEREANRLKPMVRSQIQNDIDEEWRGVMTLPDLQSTTFDFQILRNLLEGEHDDNSENRQSLSSPGQHNQINLNQQYNRMRILQSKQKGDTWRYDIGVTDQEEHTADHQEQQQTEENEASDDDEAFSDVTVDMDDDEDDEEESDEES